MTTSPYAIYASYLPRATRAALHGHKWTDIHYSQIALARACPAKLSFALAEPPGTRRSVRLLLGSMFHLALQGPDEAKQCGGMPAYWLSLLTTARAAGHRRGNTGDYVMPDGSVVELPALEALANRLADPSTYYGVGLGDVVCALYKQMRTASLTIRGNEHPLKLLDGYSDGAGVTWAGTVDLLVQLPNQQWGVLDCKTAGLWDRALGTGSVDKQSVDDTNLRWHPQLRHYDWLLFRRGVSLAVQGLLLPANLVPYASGPNRGRVRGLAMALTTPAAAHRATYQTDLFDFIGALASQPRWWRAMPSTFGQSDCPTCPYFDACTGASQLQSGIPDYLQGAAK